MLQKLLDFNQEVYEGYNIVVLSLLNISQVDYTNSYIKMSFLGKRDYAIILAQNVFIRFYWELYVGCNIFYLSLLNIGKMNYTFLHENILPGSQLLPNNVYFLDLLLLLVII